LVFVDFDNQVGGGAAGMVGTTDMGCGIWCQLPISAVWDISHDLKVVSILVQK